VGVISLVVAHDRRRAIGRAGTMPWHLPDDLRRFKQLTLGKAVLMGRKTAESIGRALPGRRNLVLTRSEAAPYDTQHVVRSIDEAIALAGDGELAVIGGGEVYALALPFADRIHLTDVDAIVPDADVYFPPYDASRWTETARVHHAADARHAYAFDFVDFERRLP
jgi:dihydrofolate reductase